MSPTLAYALKVLERQTLEDPTLAETVVFLAEEAEGPADPFGVPPAGVVLAAGALNERRLRERRERAAEAALDTAAVVALVGSIADRKGVDRRRHRGQLLGWRSGARTLHPDWQFDTRRGETRRELPTVLSALREVTEDPEAADALMRAPREDLDGGTLADLFRAGRVDTVIRLICASTDQS